MSSAKPPRAGCGETGSVRSARSIWTSASGRSRPDTPAESLLEPRLKAAASPNKDWGWTRWSELARQLGRDGHIVAQFAEPGATTLPGVEAIRAPSFRAACAVLARARLAVLPEGGLHHAAAAMGTPSIVIFGGFISPRQTGYLHQVNLFTGGTPCGMRHRCRHCELAMRRIPIDEVLAKARMLAAATADAAL